MHRLKKTFALLALTAAAGLLSACDGDDDLDKVSETIKASWVALDDDAKGNVCFKAKNFSEEDFFDTVRPFIREVISDVTDVEPGDDGYYDLVEDGKWLFIGEIMRYCG